MPIRKQLVKSVSSFSAMTFVSRVFGFIRDVLIAQIFGAVAGLDAFFVAFKIPNFMRRLFAEGAFSQAFIPVLAQVRVSEDKQKIQTFINHITGNLILMLLLVTGLVWYFSPWVIRLFAPGFSEHGTRFVLASDLLRITIPYLLFISLTAFISAILNSYGRFALAALNPALLNITLIVAAYFFSQSFYEPVTALAWGVFVAGILQFSVQCPLLYRLGYQIHPKPCWRDPHIHRVLTLLVPALFGASVAQLNLLIVTLFASFLPVGSVSWLYFSDRLVNFPLGVFGVAIATVILPQLSREQAKKSAQAFSDTLAWGMQQVLLLAIPTALGLFYLSEPILVTLFGYGNFTQHDVAMTRLSLMAYALGLPAFMLMKSLASAFYAKQDVKTPVLVGLIAVIINIVLNAILIKPLAHAGLALASSIASYVNVGLLLMILYKRGLWPRSARWFRFLFQWLFSNGLLMIWLINISSDSNTWFTYTLWQRIGSLTQFIFIAVLIYGISLGMTGYRLKR